ncbi:MAG: glycosyltransferase, partial [Campylobacterales bacterium]|nr:glycosyltransferase [Campylobacterales bacterium]
QVSQIENIGVNLDSKKITFVHAPSNRIVKGTKYIISAIEKLKSQGYDIDLHLVEGMTNEQALEIYKTADVIIDQLLAGWYGAFAVECMSMGKPVVAYIRESDLRHVDISMKDEIPIINSNPETIYKTVKSLVEAGKEKLYDIGQDSREFCLKWHEPKYIASQMKKIYGDRK